MTRDPRFLPCEGIYLQSHSAGRPPASVADALAARFIAPWAQGRDEPWPRWLAAIDDFRAALGTVLGGDPQDFCPQDNLSAG
ncbi:MAG: aminotransferase, partial [Gammaproteobacteria bacterium]